MRFLILAAVAFLCGCAGGQTAKMLQERGGAMDYEEAIQRFGAPAQCAESGRTKACTWVYGSAGAMLLPAGNGGLVAVPTEAPTARMTFTDGHLSNWQLTGNWQ